MGKAESIHAALAKHGIRLFNLSLGNDITTFVHLSKTVDEWRSDVRRILSESAIVRSSEHDATDASECLFNNIQEELSRCGYEEVTEVVADAFEGRIVALAAKVVDDPSHGFGEDGIQEKRTDGFGHYGWENKRCQEP